MERLIVKLVQGDNLADVFALFSNLTISDIGVIALMFLLYGSFLFLTVTTTYSGKDVDCTARTTAILLKVIKIFLILMILLSK